MKNHQYVEAHGETCGTCGKSIYHEEHFDGDRKAAAGLYLEDQRRGRAAGIHIGSRVVIAQHHATLGNRHGVVTHVEAAFCTVKLDYYQKSQINLPVGVPKRYLDVEPLIIPKFKTQDEADRWLEEHNPVPDPVPRFATMEEAEKWLEDHHVCRLCGDSDDHGGRPCSSVPKRVGRVPRTNFVGSIVIKPGDTVTMTYTLGVK